MKLDTRAKAGAAIATSIAAITNAIVNNKSVRLIVRNLLLCEVAGCATGSVRPTIAHLSLRDEVLSLYLSYKEHDRI